jgi:hypothetical protein
MLSQKIGAFARWLSPVTFWGGCCVMKIDRRSFVNSTLVGAAGALLPASHSWAGVGSNRAIAVTPLYKVVFDARFPASVAFGTEARSLGLATHSIRGDITDLWFHDLDVQWKKSPAAVAGLTAQGAIFCLERLAWDHGMRVVFRGDHQYLPDGWIEHALAGPASVMHQASGLGDDGDDWGARLASLVARVPEGQCVPAEATLRTRAAASANAEPESLISWVIAPVAGARIMRKG